MKEGIVCLLLLLLMGTGIPTSAHELNPKVVKFLTGETITYDHGNTDGQSAVVADPRDESRAFFSFPEWYIVYSAQEYASFVTAGRRPSQFPFFASIGQMWDSWKYAETAAGVPPDATTKTVLWTIALSFTLEYGVIGLYENTIGRITEWLHFGYKTTEDIYVDEQAATYGTFLNQTPWYVFPYVSALRGLWQTYGWSSLTPRGLERRLSFTLGYAVKALYAAAIGALSASTFEGEAGLITTVAVTTDPAALDELAVSYRAATTTSEYIVELPRYRAFRDPLIALANQGAEFSTIQDHDIITLSLVAARETECAAVFEHEAFQLPILTDETRVRRLLRVPVPELASVMRTLSGCGLAIEHIYDY